MPIPGIEQPEYIDIDNELRLRKYTDDCAFALKWYQDEETLMLVDGKNQPYTMERVYQMYRYLEARGEVYFIEYRADENMNFTPIGDVTFWQNDMPIVIGESGLRGRGIGSRVINTLLRRAKELGYEEVYVDEIYDYNEGSKTMFMKAGFMPCEQTEKGHRYKR